MNAAFDLAPGEWATLRQLLDEALAQPANERETWVGRLGAQFDVFKPRLRALLAHAAASPAMAVLDTLPKIETAQFAAGPPDSLPAGTTVGPYRLIRPLGEGGMGAVWLAERTDMLHKRQVALKLPRLATGRAALAERLAREREILAAFSHPNIARLYDAGISADGQPYLALEYVDGERIDAYCRRKQLDVPARLRLMLQVANAVAHAHANLVVHRDLKPTNILVTEGGEVRLLDFGIAKLLEDGGAQETELTQLAGRALTPDYASPEQIAGQPIGVASDIYSLGVVLFELLSGERPYQLKRDSRAALEEAILTADAPLPSAVAADAAARKALRGDLDTIVLKALKKSPEQRYATAHALVEDIERYRAGRPVLAQPDRRSYRLRKFVARNRLAVGATAAVLLAVIAGAGVAVWQARLAMQEQARAEEVKGFIASMFRDANPYSTDGKNLSALELLKQSAEKVASIDSSRTGLRVELMNLIGEALLALQDTATAESILRRAAVEGLSALPRDHPLLLETRSHMVTVHRFRGRTKEMKAEIETLLPLLRERVDAMPASLVIALKDEAHLAIDEGRYAAAVDASREAADLATAKLGTRHVQTAAAIQVYGLSLLFDGQPAEALHAAQRAHELTLQIRGGDHAHPQTINSRSTYARALAANGQLDEAIRELKRAIDDAGEVFGQRSRMVGFFSQNLVRYQVDAGQVKDAIESSQRAISVLAEHSQEESSTFGAALNARGAAYLAAYDGSRAVNDLGRSLSIARKVLGERHDATLRAAATHAAALAMAGQSSAALESVKSFAHDPTVATTASGVARLATLAMAARLAGDSATAAQLLARISGEVKLEGEHRRTETRWKTELGLHQVADGRNASAEQTLRSALSIASGASAADSPEKSEILVGLAISLLHQGRSAEALTHLQRADAFWTGFDAKNRWAGEAAFWLGKCYSVLGRSGEASQAFARAARVLTVSPLPGDARLAQRARAG